jgi:hypothetical protein
MWALTRAFVVFPVTVPGSLDQIGKSEMAWPLGTLSPAYLRK